MGLKNFLRSSVVNANKNQVIHIIKPGSQYVASTCDVVRHMSILVISQFVAAKRMFLI